MTSKTHQYLWRLLILATLILLLSLDFYTIFHLYLGTDEAVRRILPTWILQHQRLPVGNESAIQISSYGFSYAMAPYLPMVLAALLAKLILIFKLPLTIYQSFRLLSALSGLGTFICTYLTGKIAFKHPGSAYLLAVLCSFWPTSLMLQGYLNEDAFELFGIALVIYAWFLMYRDRLSYKSCALMAIGVACCLLSYDFAYAYPLMSLLVFIFLAIFFKMQSPQVLKRVLAVLGIAVSLSAWYFGHNLLYFHDLFMFHTQSLYEQKYANHLVRTTLLNQTPKKLGLSIIQMFDAKTLADHPHLASHPWLRTTFDSFLQFTPGIRLNLTPKKYLSFVAFIMISSFLGLLRSGMELVARHWNLAKTGLALGLTLGGLGSVLISIYYSWASDWQPQGRYVIGLLIPLALLMTAGLDFLDRIFKKRIFTVALALIFLLFSLYVYKVAMLPYFSAAFTG